MIYSRTSEYAIRALGCLASRPRGTPATLTEVSGETGVSRTYAAKIFQCLVGAGILGSKSGPRGGYFLRVDPARLTLLRIIRAVDDAAGSPLSGCVMGQAECDGRSPCSLHSVWVKARARLSRRLAAETILDAARLKDKSRWRRVRRSQLSKRMKHVFGR